MESLFVSFVNKPYWLCVYIFVLGVLCCVLCIFFLLVCLITCHSFFMLFCVSSSSLVDVILCKCNLHLDSYVLVVSCGVALVQ